MKIALIGYGVMGKQIEIICRERGHEIVLVLGRNRNAGWEEDLRKADVAIEFTEPGTVVGNLKDCFKVGVPVVTGTTGWFQHLDEVQKACDAASGGLFYASNFSIGVNLFFQLNKQLAAMMGKYPEYHAELKEAHHIRKKDAPSGTAITLAEGLIEANPIYKSWKLGETSAEGELAVEASREGDIPGTHSIKWESKNDSITITHEAFNRKGFALGAVIAAEFMKEKSGVFSMTDLFNSDTNYGN